MDYTIIDQFYISIQHLKQKSKHLRVLGDVREIAGLHSLPFPREVARRLCAVTEGANAFYTANVQQEEAAPPTVFNLNVGLFTYQM